ncbi:MAG: hypothetical protein SOY02_01920 [Candidatus Onthovivens sp.]|nr:hypothetical protein [Candidatus Onthovivens sp.]
MKKSQKSKIVLCSILGLAAISIGSVGFATWLVGVNKTEEELHVEAVVDDTKNDSVYLDVAVANSPFYVAESSAIPKDDGNKIVGASNDGTSALKVTANAMKFTFSRFELSVGGGVTNMPKAVKVEFTKDLNPTNWGAADLIKDAKFTTVSGETVNSNNEVGSKRKALSSGETFSYISYSEIFTIGESGQLVVDSSKSNGNYNVYKLNVPMVRSFSWGTFFTKKAGEAKSPANFYNEIYSEYTTSPDTKYMTGAQTFDFSNKIHKEISALNTTFTSAHTLKIKASVVF